MNYVVKSRKNTFCSVRRRRRFSFEAGLVPICKERGSLFLQLSQHLKELPAVPHYYFPCTVFPRSACRSSSKRTLQPWQFI